MKRKLVPFIVLIGFMLMANQALAFTGPTYTSKKQYQWTIGFSKNYNSMAPGKQGSNGWYAVYTPEHNRNGSIDLLKVKECQWVATGSSGNYWKYYGVSNVWIPQGTSGDENWWLQDCNGRIDPAGGSTQYTGGFAWAAPEDGNYTVSADFVAGGGNQVYDDGIRYYATDGVTISMHTKDGLVARANAAGTTPENLNLSQGNLTKNLAMKKGEMVYFLADPQSGGDYDYCQFSINITLDEEPDEDESDQASTGNGSGNSTGNGTGTDNGAGNNSSDTKSESSNQSDSSTNKKTNDASEKNNGNGTGTVKNPSSVALPQTASVVSETTETASEEAEEKETTKKIEIDGTLYALNQESLETVEISEEEDESTEASAEGGTGESETPEEQNAMTIILGIGLLEAIGIGIVFKAGYFKLMK